MDGLEKYGKSGVFFVHENKNFGEEEIELK